MRVFTRKKQDMGYKVSRRWRYIYCGLLSYGVV